MEEQYDTPDPEFVKGFNEGYTIAQHLPDLSQQLAEVKSDSPRLAGFLNGREQFLLEREQEKYPTWLKGDFLDKGKDAPDPTKERDRDIDRDR